MTEPIKPSPVEARMTDEELGLIGSGIPSNMSPEDERRLYAEARRARAEVETLKRERDALRAAFLHAQDGLASMVKERDALSRRLEAAEKERERLREALKGLVDHVSGCIDCTEAVETGGCVACDAMNALAPKEPADE